MTRAKVSAIRETSDAAPNLKRLQILTKYALSSASSYELSYHSWPDVSALSEFTLRSVIQLLVLFLSVAFLNGRKSEPRQNLASPPGGEVAWCKGSG